MVQNTMTTQQYLYIDYNTSNKSFRDMYEFLKDIGIKNNSFFLVLLDPDLVGVNPRDPRLNRMMKTKIFQECMRNYWYFIREVVRVPDSGGAAGGGKEPCDSGQCGGQCLERGHRSHHQGHLRQHPGSRLRNPLPQRPAGAAITGHPVRPIGSSDKNAPGFFVWARF